MLHNDFRDAARATSVRTQRRLVPPPSCPLSGRRDRRIIEGSPNKLLTVYSPGNMMWASDVPANITQEPPASRTSGSPTSFPHLPGTAINECLTAVASLLPQNLYHMDPTSDMMRVPSFPAAATASSTFDRSLAPAVPSAASFRFCATRGRLASLLVHSTENGRSPGQPVRSSQTIRLVPFFNTSYVTSGFHLMPVAS